MSTSLPTILEPNFDLLGLDVGKNGTLSDQLLPSQGAGLGALSINPFEGFNLLSRVSYIFPGIKVLINTPTAVFSVLSHSHGHLP